MRHTDTPAPPGLDPGDATPPPHGLDPGDAAPAPPARPGRIRQVLRVLREDRPAVLLGALGTLIASGSGLLGPRVVQWAIQDLRDEAWSRMTLWAALYVGLSVLTAVLGAAVALLLGRAANRVVARARQRACRTALEMPLARATRHPPGDLVSRCTNDAEHLGAILREGPIQVMGVATVVLGAGVGMWLADPVLCLLVAPLLAACGGVAALATRPVGRHTLAYQSALGAFSAEAQRCFEALRTLRANVAEGFALTRLGTVNGALVVAADRSLLARCIVGPVMLLSAHLAAALVVAVVVWRSVGGDVDADRVVAFFMYAVMLVGPLGQVGSLLTSIAVAAGALGRLDELQSFARATADHTPASLADHTPASLADSTSASVAIPRTRVDTAADQASVVGPDRLVVAHPTPLPASTVFDVIRFQDVGLDLPADQPGGRVRILQHVSFEIRPGTHVVLAGASGAGKSTVLALLARLYAPTAGRITVGGTDLRGWDPAAYRAHVGYVEQSSPLFRGTVRDNLTLGDPNIHDDDCWRMLGRLDLADEVASRSGGLDASVGEGNDTFSGGQRQRLALARALLRRPRILLLDEVTSALDERAASAAWEAVREAGASVIHAGHGPGLLDRADRVIHLSGGRVVEAEGTGSGGLLDRQCAESH